MEPPPRRHANRTDDLFQINVRHWTDENTRKAPPPFTEPIETACFTNHAGKITPGSRSELKRFVQPPVNVNLNNGIESFVPKGDNKSPAEELVNAVLAQSPNVFREADIVTYRYNLNKIGNTPYDPNSAWEFDCCCATEGGAVILDTRPQHEDPKSGHQFNLMYHGYRYEAVCTGTENEPVDATACFCSVSKSKLGDCRILLASEIDCTDGETGGSHEPIREYLELKVMVPPNDRSMARMYRDRYRRYWLQSFLGGVRTIVLGTRTHDGTLLGVQRVPTEQLSVEAENFAARQGGRMWTASLILNFLEEILNRVREACRREVGATVRVEHDAELGIVRAYIVKQKGDGLGKRLDVCFSGST